MKLSWYIARRYLASRKRGRLLSLITWIALGGVTIGVSALIVVIGVMTGMQKELQEKILTATAHVWVLQLGSSLRMQEWEGVLEEVLETEGVVSAAPFILTEVVAVNSAHYTQPAALYGVPLDSEGPSVTEIEEELPALLRATDSGLPPVALGSLLARRMVILEGDTVTLVAFDSLRLNSMGEFAPKIAEYEVTGIFETGMYDYDMKNIYAPLTVVQELTDFLESNDVSGIAAQVTEPWNASEVAARIQESIDSSYLAQSWGAKHQALFDALKLEKLAMFVILFLIVVVAAFNIVSTLVMVVADRTKEIGILKSMGMPDRIILRIFMLQGIWIGIIGTLVGTALGSLVAWLQVRYEIIDISAEVYFVDRLPVSVDPVDVLLIVVASIAVAFAATIYPALQASRLQPVEAIQHE